MLLLLACIRIQRADMLLITVARFLFSIEDWLIYIVTEPQRLAISAN
jgi:hypothetical protein